MFGFGRHDDEDRRGVLESQLASESAARRVEVLTQRIHEEMVRLGNILDADLMKGDTDE